MCTQIVIQSEQEITIEPIKQSSHTIWGPGNTQNRKKETGPKRLLEAIGRYLKVLGNFKDNYDK